MAVSREPIKSGITKFIDAISFGNFSKAKEKLKYDNLYHNYLIVKLANGQVFKIEKNHVVNVEPIRSTDYNSDVKPIPIPKDKLISTKDLIENAAKKEGPEFWRYSPDKNNCQKFIADIIEENDLDDHITDPKTKELITPQDGVALVNSIGALKGVPQVVTDFAHKLDTLVKGEGLKGKGISVDQLFDLVNS